MNFEPYLKAIENAPNTTGKTQLLRHLNGETLTRAQAIKAQCCMCMGYYHDGREDCEISYCPLYQYMPYRKRDKIKQKATPEQLDALRKARIKRKGTNHDQL